MDRLVYALLLAALLMMAPARGSDAAGWTPRAAQPVFFSMLFPQLTPWGGQEEATPGEAVFL